MSSRLWILALALSCATPKPAPVENAAPPPGVPPAIAKVDGQAITAAEVAAHQADTKLEPDEALDDLIDLTLLKSALRANGLALDTATPAARAAAEYALARKLALPVPAAGDVLVVDHAWVKDADAPKKRAAQKAAMEKLRTLVAAGATIPVAYPKLGTEGADWHIGDHEEYPYDVVPPAAHDLAPGSLSPIIPGDGGLHLFTIHARKPVPPAPEAVHPLVRDKLREGKTIERPTR